MSMTEIGDQSYKFAMNGSQQLARKDYDEFAAPAI